MRPWGRFSVRGSPAFEERMTALLREIASKANDVLAPPACRAMVLLGGYGRGEGGVMVTDNEEHPHNNLDFLVITRSLSRKQQQALKTRLKNVLFPLTREQHIEFDFSLVDETRLRRSPSLVMWYDMRFGHKTIWGDADLVPSLKQFAVARIPAWDVLNLLVNRGTLLLINEQLMASRPMSPEDREMIVKHAMKAIIGYGDAHLFFEGKYHWSYVEKQKRMRASAAAPEAMRHLYDMAIEFRFQPDVAPYSTADLRAWMAELRQVLEPIHLACERKRLGRSDLTWHAYPEAAFRNALHADMRSLRAWAKKAVNCLRTPGAWSDASGIGPRLGYRVLGKRGILPILFPAVAYAPDDKHYREFTARFLHAENTARDELRRAYLHAWGNIVEPNFLCLAGKWRMPLTAGETP